MPGTTKILFDAQGRQLLRRKQAYIDAHPQIRAHGGRLLPDDYNSSEDENLV
jgi:hypothetical protein